MGTTSVPDSNSSGRFEVAAEILLSILVEIDRKREFAKEPISATGVPCVVGLNARIVTTLQSHGAMQPRFLRAVLGVSAMTLSRALSRLLADGRISADGHTKARRYVANKGIDQ